MGIEREKIKRVQDQVKESDLGLGHKEALDDMLLATYKATNGEPDKMQALTEALAAVGICLARDAIHRQSDFDGVVDKALTKHRLDCPLNARPAAPAEEVEYSGIFGKLKAKGVGAMSPLVKLAAIIVAGGVLVYGAHYIAKAHEQLDRLSAQVQAK